MSPGPLPILTYHAIDESGSVVATSRARFVETLDALDASGFRAVDLETWVEQGRPAVDRGFALAFDDGLASILAVADEIVRRSIPVTIFVVTGRVGGDNAWPGQPSGVPRSRLLGWPELASLDRLGFRFGSHGATHARLDRLSTAALEAELVDSRDAIEQRFGRPCPMLAYPYGASGVRARDLAAATYEAAFGTRLAYASGSDDRAEIARVDACYLKSRGSLDRLTSGRWRRRLAVRRALRTIRRSVVDLARIHA